MFVALEEVDGIRVVYESNSNTTVDLNFYGEWVFSNVSED